MFTKRYAVTYINYTDAAFSSPRVGRTFRTRRGAQAQAMRFMRNETRGGLYSTTRVA